MRNTLDAINTKMSEVTIKLNESITGIKTIQWQDYGNKKDGAKWKDWKFRQEAKKLYGI